MHFGIIYRAFNTLNGKSYIGQTINSLAVRRKQHEARKRSLLAKAIKKYSKSSFEWSIVTFCSSRNELDDAEKYWIKFFDTISPNGYNLREGGDSGGKVSEETRMKMRISAFHRPASSNEKIAKTLREKNIKPPTRAGSKSSNETREKISKAMKGRRYSDETKRKISETLKLRARNKTRFSVV